MGRDYVMKAIADIKKLAIDEGLDFYPTIFEHVDRDIMLEACSYGLPVRARHWSYGRSYQHQKIYGEMGFSKVYEIVFNNDPSYAFLMNTNPDVINIMVGAHVYGHSHFFKNNVLFKGSDRSMIYRAAERAARVDKYIEQYGLDAVEHLMDIGFALDNHIDWHKGLFRDKYPKKRIVEVVKRAGEFEDLLNIGNTSKRSVVRKTVGDKLPPHPEKDLLWFIINYAPLEDWERDVLGIIREESFYFYPIVMTKIANEGFACVTPDTLTFTENGIMEMKDVIETRPIIFDGESNKKVVYSGVFKGRDTIKIYTNRGLVVCGANNHRILDSNNNWKQLDEICCGDMIKISGGGNLWSKQYHNIEFEPNNKAQSKRGLCKKFGIGYNTYFRNKNGLYNTSEQNIKKIKEIDNIMVFEKDAGFAPSCGNRVDINIPKTFDENFGKFLGYMIGDGHISTKARQIGLTTGDEYSKNDFENLVLGLFGPVHVRTKWDNSSKNGRYRVIVYSKNIIDLLVEYFGLTTGVSARIKQIPSVILRSPKSVMSAFLRSYFDCDGCASEKQGIILSTSSDKLSEQVQIVLLNYGILSTRKKAKDECWQLRITGTSAKKFYEEIGFGLERKQQKLRQYVDQRKWFKKEKWEDKIVRIENCGKQDVYDISVEDTHRYAAAGFVNHNSFWHAELMYKYDKLSPTEYIQFAQTHSSVINPGNSFSLNPYYLGFKIFTDIRKRWDEKFERGESNINGIQKVIQVAAEEDDASFLRNYLTKELATDLGMFSYGYRLERHPDDKDEDLTEEHGVIELKDRELNKIIDNIIRPTINYGAPLIAIEEVDGDALILRHSDEFGPLDVKYASKTMEYLYEIWGGPIELRTYTHGGDSVTYSFDESGFETV